MLPTVKQTLLDSFNLSIDLASPEEIREDIEAGAKVKGTNMCILILAILIASIGLNMNSTAVIIDSNAVADGLNAAHEGRDQHGTDDDGGGIHIQTDRGDQDCQDQNAHIGALDLCTGFNIRLNFFRACKINAQVEGIAEGFPDRRKQDAHPLS